MVLVRKKLNKSAIILLALLVVAAIVAVVLHFTGFMNLAFIGDYAILGAMWASSSGWNVAIAGGVFFAAGMGTFWWLKDYIIGTEVAMGAGMNTGYVPQDKVSAPASSGMEVSA